MSKLATHQIKFPPECTQLQILILITFLRVFPEKAQYWYPCTVLLCLFSSGSRRVIRFIRKLTREAFAFLFTGHFTKQCIVNKLITGLSIRYKPILVWRRFRERASLPHNFCKHFYACKQLINLRYTNAQYDWIHKASLRGAAITTSGWCT